MIKGKIGLYSRGKLRIDMNINRMCNRPFDPWEFLLYPILYCMTTIHCALALYPWNFSDFDLEYLKVSFEFVTFVPVPLTLASSYFTPYCIV